MFVLQAEVLAKPDQHTQAIEETLKQRRNIEQIWKLCKMIDRDGSNTISRDEFYESIASQNMRYEFMVCGLNIHNAEDFFELLLDLNNGDEVQLDQFVAACVMMRGNANAIEQTMMLREARDFQNRVGEHFYNLKHWQFQVMQKLNALVGAR
mmetsp:Transcript_134909/g.262743  ORF Transcript_134909/g.262743 Transcript_134909/m.262743 type:complete len:152 (+) Transcript_134909:1-456(+)